MPRLITAGQRRAATGTAKTSQKPPQTADTESAYHFTKVSSVNLWRLLEGLQKSPRTEVFIGMGSFIINELSKMCWSELCI